MIPITFIPVNSFGASFVSSKYARPYRYKCRKARTNNRTNNKKKLRSTRVIK